MVGDAGDPVRCPRFLVLAVFSLVIVPTNPASRGGDGPIIFAQATKLQLRRASAQCSVAARCRAGLQTVQGLQTGFSVNGESGLSLTDENSEDSDSGVLDWQSDDASAESYEASFAEELFREEGGRSALLHVFFFSIWPRRGMGINCFGLL